MANEGRVKRNVGRSLGASLATFVSIALLVSGPARAVVMSETVHIGDIFTVPISVSNAVGLTSYQFDLSFNPAIIGALSIDDNSTDFATEAANDGGVLVGITAGIDNSTGLLSRVADSMSGNSGPGLTPGGTIADITFEALSPGTTSLTLANVFLTDGGRRFELGTGQLQNGSVTVAAVPAPALGSGPSGVALAAVLLALVGAGRLRPRTLVALLPTTGAASRSRCS